LKVGGFFSFARTLVLYPFFSPFVYSCDFHIEKSVVGEEIGKQGWRELGRNPNLKVRGLPDPKEAGPELGSSGEEDDLGVQETTTAGLDLDLLRRHGKNRRRQAFENLFCSSPGAVEALEQLWRALEQQ